MEYSWPLVETNDFVSGWHIDAICDHLEAVSKGQILRLIINMPPRHMKSLSCSVFWPAWDWLDNPGRRFLFSSYAESLSIRDSRKCRLIIQSSKYQRMCQYIGMDMSLAGDQNAKVRYENNHGGVRLATSVDGSNTGEGGDIIGVDDAHNVRDVESTTQRESVIEWWKTVMSSRLNNPKTGAKVLMMQRSHHEDLSGYCLKKMVEDVQADQWETLILPARYEDENRSKSSITFVDPRKKIDEPLWPEMYGDEQLASLESELGAYGAAGQLQQRPSPKKGGMIPAEKLRLVTTFPKHRIIRSVRYWDKAGTEGGGAYTAGVLMHLLNTGRFVISDVVRGQWSAGKREAIIKQTAQMDALEYSESNGVKLKAIDIWVEQEPGSGGKESALNTVINLSGFPVHADPVGASDGNKRERARPFAAQVEAENVDIVIGPWNKAFVEECCAFDKGKYKDQVDGSSGAFNKLHIKPKRAGLWPSRQDKNRR